MTAPAWVMLLVAVVLLGGGLSLCIGIAVAVNRRKQDEGVDFRSEDDD
jgi:hypothetical protein